MTETTETDVVVNPLTTLPLMEMSVSCLGG